MIRYTGNHCPVCEQVFTDEDDIVVCPDCGTPYHRACWQKVGACMHTSEHAAGFEWQPEFGPEADQAAHAATCPNCGTHNTPGAVRCSHCGCPLPRGETSSAASQDHDAGQGPIYARDPASVNSTARKEAGPHFDAYGASEDGGVYRREIGPDDAIDGIKAKYWAAYVGRSPVYYLMQFFRMSVTKRKTTICLSALFFGPGYLFYRKVWKPALITALLTVLLSVPNFMEIIATFNPGFFGALPLGWLPVAATICQFASWGLNVVMGLYAVSWYRDTAKRNISSICTQYPEGDTRTAALVTSGGTNLLAAILYFGLLALLEVAILYMAGPSAVQYLMAAAGM